MLVALAALVALCLLPFMDRSEQILQVPSGSVYKGINYTATVGGRQYLFALSALEIFNSGRHAVTNPPPLPLSEAVALSADSLIRYISVDEAEVWLPDNIALIRNQSERWYFAVTYRPPGGGLNADGTPIMLRIPVLLNRMVVRGVLRGDRTSAGESQKEIVESLGLPVEEFLTAEQMQAEKAALPDDVTLVSEIGPRRIDFTIPGETLRQSPDYEFSGEMPLDMHEAVAAALRECARYRAEAPLSVGDIDRVSLNRWGNTRKWYYLVEFSMAGGGSAADAASRLKIPVLLNGEVVQGDFTQTGWNPSGGIKERMSSNAVFYI